MSATAVDLKTECIALRVPSPILSTRLVEKTYVRYKFFKQKISEYAMSLTIKIRKVFFKDINGKTLRVRFQNLSTQYKPTVVVQVLSCKNTRKNLKIFAKTKW